MAEAHPALVGTEVGHGNATKMGTNGRAHQNLGVDGVRQGGHGDLIQEGRVGQRASLLHLGQGQTTDEDKLTVPRCLEHFTRWQLGDIEFLVGVSDVSSSRDHLLVEASDDSFNSKHVAADDKALEHIDLSSLNFVVLVLLIPESIKLIGVRESPPRCKMGSYLFSSNQLSTLVLVSMGSPKLEGRDEVTQNFCSSVHKTLLINFLFFLSVYSWIMPKFLAAEATKQRGLRTGPSIKELEMQPRGAWASRYAYLSWQRS